MWFRALGTAFGRGWLSRRGFDAYSDSTPSPYTAAGYAYDTALGMCGNEGQISIIETIGFQGFLDAAFYALEGEDAVETLVGMASHPEAVEEILEETGMIINDIMGEIAGNSMGDVADDDSEGE